jgi:hypothetical protein
MNQDQINEKVLKIDRLVSQSVKAYENTCDPTKDTAFWAERERLLAQLVQDEIHAVSDEITVDWPGLYPMYSYKGYEYFFIHLKSLLTQNFLTV